MAWNEPGGGNGGKDPWNSGGGKNNPPDLDELLKSLSDKLGGIFSGGKGGDSGGGGAGSSASFAMLGLVVAALIWAALGVYQLDAKEQAVVLRLGKFHGIVGDGLHWNPPLVDSVAKINVTEMRQYHTSGEMLTEDENIVEVPLTVQYNIKNVKDFVLNVKDPIVSLQHATDSALRHVVGSTGLDAVLSIGRQKLGVDIQDRLQTYLDIYDAGINIVTVNVLEGKPPSAVKDAYDDVIKAREDRERYINEAQAYANGIVPEAQGRAKRVSEEATAYKARVIAEAEGDAKRFLSVLAEYKKAPEVTRERMYLDALQEVFANTSKVLIDVEGGNNMMYLPLDKLAKQSSSLVGERGGVLDDNDINSIANRVIENINKRAQSSTAPRREPR
ncbi:MAG TPA: FtsH protease activity modulator HflK [Porticoccaceae bacterium]|nr:FtsH protease activity modulator HflK [Porticoccaceae bacterium]HCO58875.1 FtsH protease activity modulator HflK [Porticoccaceae bacterium]